MNNSTSPENSQTANPKKRVRQWTSSDRARHRVFEKERREAFNERLLELAGLLPRLEGAKQSQLSKHIIVHESIRHHRAQNATTTTTTEQLQAVLAERDALLAEVNQWRTLCGLDAAQPRAPAALGASDAESKGPDHVEIGDNPQGLQSATLLGPAALDTVIDVQERMPQPLPETRDSISIHPAYTFPPPAMPNLLPMNLFGNEIELPTAIQGAAEPRQYQLESIDHETFGGPSVPHNMMDFYMQRSTTKCLPFPMSTT